MIEDANQQMALQTGNSTAPLDTMGKRIRAVLKAKRMKLGDTAEKIGISRTSLSQWVSDDVANPDTRKLRALSSLVDVSLDWLIDRKGKDPEFLGVPSPHKKRAAKVALASLATSSPDDGVSVPEIAPSLSVHAAGINFDARHYWSIPSDVLELGFNCNAATTVVKRIVTRDGKDFGLNRGDYVLIDTSRTRIDEPGIYVIADPEGVSARRILVDMRDGDLHITVMADDTERSFPQDSGDNFAVLGRVMGIFKPA